MVLTVIGLNKAASRSESKSRYESLDNFELYYQLKEDYYQYKQILLFTNSNSLALL